MSDYVKGTNFAAKDALLSGDANKIVSGTEIDDEYSLVRTAVNSKTDEQGGTLTNGDINTPDIDGGTMDGTAINGGSIGASNPVTTVSVDNININGNTISSTDTDGNIVLTPNGTGEVDISKVDIDSGNIDSTVIGGTTPAALTATTITGTTVTASDVVVDTNVLVVDGTTNDNVGIGTATPDSSFKLDVVGNVRATEFYGGGSNLTGINTGFIYVDAGALSGSEKEITLPDTDISELILLVENSNSSNSTSNFEVFLKAQFSTSSGYLASGDYSGGLLFSYVDWNGASNVRIQEYEGAGSGGFPFAMDESDVSNNWAKLHVTIPATGKLFLEGGYGADAAMGTANGWADAGAAITKFKIAWTGQNFSSGNLYYGYRKNAI